jgi:Helitron helicase-like domain at N-terminus
MATITRESLERACEEENRGSSISDPAVRLLQRNVHTTIRRVKGSNQSRLQLRSQIWSTCIMKNPASLWITINPTDIQDPIAQVFAGEDIDMDSFLSCSGPNVDERVKNVANDPYAAAKFFHFIIHLILETLFGVKITDFQVYNKIGIFGRVSAYFGTVESQGRGTLHFHLLLWLEDAPQAHDIKDLLKSTIFKSRVVSFIQQNLRAYVPGLESAETVKAIPREADIAFSRPIHPDVSDYEEQSRMFELRLARTEQIHTCRIHQCLVQDKKGEYYCKRRAPFKLSDIDDITETGEWIQKRLYEYVNGWVPGILLNVRCNNDGKLLTNGSDTKKVARYTTTYVAKKQNKNYNASAVMARGYAYHLDRLDGSNAYLDGVRDVQRMLLFRLVNALNGEQEFAAPMVISYLMGWGDTYRSHHYSPIYWSSFVQTLLKTFPELQMSNR